VLKDTSQSMNTQTAGTLTPNPTERSPSIWPERHHWSFSDPCASDFSVPVGRTRDSSPDPAVGAPRLGGVSVLPSRRAASSSWRR
jgi:hypothetical protein